MVLRIALIGLTISVVVTAIARQYALATELLDVPNERSSHVVATPRGGGIGIVAAITVCVAYLFSIGHLDRVVASMLVVTGIVVATVGLIDDRRGLGPGVRLAVHAAAAATVVLVVGVRPVPMPQGWLDLGAVGLGLGWVAVVWSVNLFNFMDGIDGLAAAEAVFVFSSGAVLSLWAGADGKQVELLVAAAASAAGFLAWNWPPARIFMGDVGSGFLGLLIATMALVTSSRGGMSLWTWVILYGVFVSDSTSTLILRATRGEQIHMAHRNHCYQKLARRWDSHSRVVAVCFVINVFWLLPWAAITIRLPTDGAWCAVVALLPLVISSVWLGAGSNDRSAPL